MTVNIPQKAGFVATTKEWDDLVRIAENLAAQVVQRDAALRGMQAERDAAQSDAHKWAALANEKANALDAARSDVPALCAEVRELRAALEQARALIPADVFECNAKRGYALCGCGGDHCSWCTFPEWAHKLAALLAAAPGGAA